MRLTVSPGWHGVAATLGLIVPGAGSEHMRALCGSSESSFTELRETDCLDQATDEQLRCVLRADTCARIDGCCSSRSAG